MKIGIIGAMENEVKTLRSALSEPKTTKKAGMEFCSGKLSGKEVIVVRSGVGKVNAAICTQILIDTFGADTIINTGAAGSLDTKINIGDIVLATDSLQHDMDATGFGSPVGQIPMMKCFSFPTDQKLLEAAKKACLEVNDDIRVFTGRTATGDQFICDKAKKEFIVNTFGAPLCCDMEGSAVAQTAYLNEKPSLIIRSVSDKADDSAGLDYPTFEKLAVEHTVKLLINMLEKL